MRRQRTAEINITEGPIWQQLLYFFFPLLLGTFFQQLYNTTDAVIVGHFVGKEALSAVGGTTSTFISFLVNIFVGLSTGAAVIIAQFYGAQKKEDVHRAVHTSAALALTAGIIITAVGILVSRPALIAMHTPDDILPYAETYMMIYFAGSIPSFLYNIGSGILRAVGDTRRPLYFLMVSCLANIVLDLIFVAALQLGVVGVGIATVLSQVLSAVLVLAALLKANPIYRLVPKDIRFSRDIFMNILRIGIPAGIQADMYSISNIMIQSSINKFSTDTIAAWTAFSKIDGFYWIISGAFGMAITTFVSQNFGAQKYDRVRKSVRVSLLMDLAITGVITVLFCFAAGPLLQIFISDPAVLDIGAGIVLRFCPFYVTFICMEILSGAIRGAGDSLMPMLITCGGVCVLRMLWIWFVLPAFPAFETIIASYPFTWIITSTVFILYYLRGGWMKKCIRKMGYAPEIREKHHA